MKDPVTSLFNRQQFLHILEQEINEANEHRTTIGLLVADIRAFSRINRTHGYSCGDRTLQAFADILSRICRSQDQAARIGDNLFALILPGIMNSGHAELAAFKIQRLLDAPIQLEHKTIHCTANIGIALCPDHATGPDILLREAEDALQRARQTDQPVYVAETRNDDEISDVWDIELELQDSIKESRLHAWLQPKVSLTTGKPTGAEALVRWDSPGRGLCPPDVFMPVAESTGFIKPLTTWMLNSALRLSSGWTKQWGELEVSVNIPPRILEQPDFSDLVMSTWELWKPAGIHLCLEILEQSFAGDTASVFSKLKALRDEGIKIAIDDFGTGYSSLAYFRDIPADQLKIDRSFVQGLLDDRANANIVSLVIDLAHRFGLSVVAEGVEDRKTLAMLQKMGCDSVQGFVFSRPMPAHEFENWLRDYRGIRSPAAVVLAK